MNGQLEITVKQDNMIKIQGKKAAFMEQLAKWKLLAESNRTITFADAIALMK